MLCTPGDGRKLSPGAGLLNIAGEKIEDSGILGLRAFIRKGLRFAVFFFFVIRGLFLFALDYLPLTGYDVPGRMSHGTKTDSAHRQL